MEVYVFHPQGACSREMRISHENGVIYDLEVVGGCNGNLKGIAALIKGMKLVEVKDRLKGIKCGFKSTSCPDQLSIAIDEILKNKE